MRLAKWALIVFLGTIGLLITIMVIGFIYGLIVLAIGLVKGIVRRIEARRSIPSQGEGPCSR
jgi:hypothetical protein